MELPQQPSLEQLLEGLRMQLHLVQELQLEYLPEEPPILEGIIPQEEGSAPGGRLGGEQLELRPLAWSSVILPSSVFEDAAAWIDPDLLEIKFQDCVCALCLGLMVDPASGCKEGHSFCRACYGKALYEQRKCPTCRHPVAAEGLLVRNRPLAGIIFFDQ